MAIDSRLIARSLNAITEFHVPDAHGEERDRDYDPKHVLHRHSSSKPLPYSHFFRRMLADQLDHLWFSTGQFPDFYPCAAPRPKLLSPQRVKKIGKKRAGCESKCDKD